VNKVELPEGAVLPARHPDAPAPGEELPVHYSQCFACGGTESGLHMRVRAGEGLTVQGRFLVTDHHQGAPGLAHGGLLACAFDEVLGMLGMLTHIPAVTGRLETDFRRPVPVDSTLHIHAQVDGVVGRKIYTSAVGRLGAEDGPVALTAQGLFIEVGLEHFRTHGRGLEGRDFEVNP
jgi:acyl-coenzyme A thioesterase PaaI-like protein